MSVLNSAGIFLIDTLFTLILFVLTIRLILAFFRVNYFNPLTQLIIKLTQPLVGPVRRILPTYRGIEFATLFWIIVLGMLRLTLLSLLTLGFPPLLMILFLTLTGTIKLILNTFFFAILILAILSWIQPSGYSPIIQLLEQITNPIMRPVRRIFPPVSGFDLSPIPVLIFLQFLIILLP